MLERLLAEIRLRSPLTTTVLARRLNTSPEMVDVMLERLVQLGIIKNFDQGCIALNCQGCSLGDSCKKTPRREIRLWTLA